MSCGTDITIFKGTTSRITIEYQDFNGNPIDLTGATATCVIYSLTDYTDVIETYTCTIPTPLNGQVVCVLTDAETALIPITGNNFNEGTEYWYKSNVDLGDDIERIAQGSAFVYP